MTSGFLNAAQASHVLLRVLAPLDACLLPGAALYWISTWPASGGLVGALLGVFALYVAASRACRAVWDFWAYRWMTVRLGKLALVLLAVQRSLQLVWKLQG